jgi:acetoin utilization protein AcuB
MLMPTIKQFMTHYPLTIGKDAKMSQAHTLMRTHQLRHLPVLEGGKLVGIVSERDLHLIETLRDSDPEKITVEEAMVVDVYTVTVDEPIDVVAERMAERKLGSALVVNRRGGLEGIFTSVDALQVLATVLRRATE